MRFPDEKLIILVGTHRAWTPVVGRFVLKPTESGNDFFIDKWESHRVNLILVIMTSLIPRLEEDLR